MFAIERRYAARPRQKYLCAWFRADPSETRRDLATFLLHSRIDETLVPPVGVREYVRVENDERIASPTRLEQFQSPYLAYNDVAVGVYSVADFFFYRALSRASLCPSASRSQVSNEARLVFFFFFFLLSDRPLCCINKRTEKERERERACIGARGKCVYRGIRSRNHLWISREASSDGKCIRTHV